MSQNRVPSAPVSHSGVTSSKVSGSGITEVRSSIVLIRASETTRGNESVH
jgi:hypothetical protein